MPNPTRALKRTDRLAPRQRMIVKDLRKARLPVRVYQRGRGISVHNPFLDVVRKAKKGSMRQTKRTPQARDTAMQRRLRRVKTKPKGARKVRKTRARSFLLP